jgi:hypothetical protein
MPKALYARLSFIGVIAVVAFFMPWIKACDQVDSGYTFFMADAISDPGVRTILMFIAGMFFIVAPLYSIISAHIAAMPDGKAGAALARKFFIVTMPFAMIAAVMLVWPMISAAVEAMDASYVNFSTLALCSMLYAVAVVLLIVFCIDACRGNFDIHQSERILLFNLIPPLLWGALVGARWGLWLYFFVVFLRMVFASHQREMTVGVDHAPDAPH